MEEASRMGEGFPSELLVQVFGRLDVRSLAHASAVSRRWCAVARSDTVWKGLYGRYFADLGLAKPPAEAWRDRFRHHHQRLQGLEPLMHDLDTDTLREELGDIDVFMHLCSLGVQPTGLSVSDLVQFWIACGAPDTWERSVDSCKASDAWGRLGARHRVAVLVSLAKFLISAIESLDAGQERIERGVAYFQECLELLRAFDEELALLLDPLFAPSCRATDGSFANDTRGELVSRHLTNERKELIHAYYHIYHWVGEAFYVSSTEMPRASGLDTAEMYFQRGYTLQQLLFPAHHITKAQSLMKMSGVSWRRYLDEQDDREGEEGEDHAGHLATCETLMREAWLHATRWAQQRWPLDSEEAVAPGESASACADEIVTIGSSNAWLNVYTLAEIIAGMGNIACTKGDVDRAIAYHRIGVNRATLLWGRAHPLTIFHMLQLYDVLPEEDEQVAVMDDIKESEWWSTSISKLLGLTFLFPTVMATPRWNSRIFHAWVYV